MGDKAGGSPQTARGSLRNCHGLSLGVVVVFKRSSWLFSALVVTDVLWLRKALTMGTAECGVREH